MDGNPLVRVQIDHLLHSDDLVTLDRHLGPGWDQTMPRSSSDWQCRLICHTRVTWKDHVRPLQ
jgi:hypothetical protein